MAIRKPKPKEPEESAVDLAVAALDGNEHPLDMDMRDIDPDPTSLDLDGSQRTGAYRKPHRRDPGRCACGRLLPRS
jgi:hypothetical protein